ncbi:hypothetical protein DYB32_010452 [Aphanomyces invadans]|uniref:CCHC-type domain-containing protein n=1 Tax=Aphanomyces invadans TaxID=157072 RepID=A0A3R6VDU5_9STRA|nr:hypothetical protein DYB32_010452 [Aphanomyces invadans]
MGEAYLVPAPRAQPDFIHRFDQLTTRLNETNLNQVVKLLTLMPWEFRHLVDRLLNGATEARMSTVKTELKAEWKAAVKGGALKAPNGYPNKDRALTADGGGRGNGGRGRGRGRNTESAPTKPGKYHYCGNEGHWQQDCRKKAHDESATTGNGHDRNARGNQDRQHDSTSNAAYMFSAMEAAPKMEEPQEAEPLFEDPTWSWETRPTRDVLLHWERISVLYNSHHGPEVARLGQFLVLNDPNTPPWMTHPFLIIQYDVRAFRRVDLNTEIAEEGPHYRPWSSPMDYISFPISVNGFPWAEAYQISVRRNRSLVAIIHDRITSNMDVEGTRK